MRLDQLGDEARAAGRLQRHDVLETQAGREQLKLFIGARHAAGRAHLAALFADRNLAEVAMHVHSNEPHDTSLVRPSPIGKQWARDIDGYVLAAHPGRSQGRPRTTAGSQPIGYQRPAHHALPKDAPRPGTTYAPRDAGRLHDAVSRPDNGSAFTARAFKAILVALGITHRRGGYRDPESQAFIESWFGKLKQRCVWREEFETLEQAREVIGAYVIHYHHRPHSRLNYNTPLEVAATWNDGGSTHLTAAA